MTDRIDLLLARLAARPRLSRRRLVSRSVIAIVLIVAAVGGQLLVGLGASLVVSRIAAAAEGDTYAYVGDVMTARIQAARDTAVDLAETTASAVDLLGASASDREIGLLLLERVQHADGVSAMAVALADGRSCTVVELDDGYLVRGFFADDDGELRGIMVAHDRDGRELPGTMHAEVADDVRGRAWYAAAVASSEAVWVEPDLSPTVTDARGGSGDGAAVVARTENGRTVVLVELDADWMAATLAQVPLEAPATVFLLRDDGTVLAGSPHARVRMRLAGARLDRELTAEDLGLSGLPLEAVAAGRDAVTAVDERVVFQRALGGADAAPWILWVEARPDALAPGISQTTGLVLRIVAAAAVVAAAAGVAVHWLRQDMGRLSAEARLDPLTGLTNRNAHERAAKALLRAARRSGRTAVVVAMDLDGFKALNDTYGHAAGDAALVATARALRGAVRTDDVVSRLGGDEFVCALVIGTPGSAAATAERLREAIIAGVEDDPSVPMAVGVTAGCAVAAACGHDLARTQEAADQALIAGKARGKGRAYSA
ncbi:GGDEF domain-containing protein [Demequina subtropica]|uniref:GGDEF domain-containing protein n=1 Tax=Demequina subtropica TaxID=1638989 RepID=UPI0012E0137F|nr:diguanylate cyclase [Demequina subtropica]